jgi:hypothetical protein
MGAMITVLTLLKTKPSPNGELHGERPFWREFGPQYLAVWLRNVRRFVPEPKRIVVMTDTIEDVAMLSLNHGFDVVLLDAKVDAPGFWAKLEMFKHGQGKTLYCDLDNIIAGPIDELCALTPDPLIMLDDRRVPGLPNGSMVLFDADKCRGIWADYSRDPRKFENWHTAQGDDYSRAYDQAYIAEWVESEYGFGVTLFQPLLPSGYILNARTELDTEAWKQARVLFGCGSTKPHTSKHPGFALK